MIVILICNHLWLSSLKSPHMGQILLRLETFLKKKYFKYIIRDSFRSPTHTLKSIKNMVVEESLEEAHQPNQERRAKKRARR